MANFIEYIADQSLLSDSVFDLIESHLRLEDVTRTADTSISGWNDLFIVHTHGHDNQDRPDLNTVISMRIRKFSPWDKCKMQSIKLLTAILNGTECDLEFYSFFHLMCYRRNSGINICKPKEWKEHRQFWSERLLGEFPFAYNVVAKNYSRL